VFKGLSLFTISKLDGIVNCVRKNEVMDSVKELLTMAFNLDERSVALLWLNSKVGIPYKWGGNNELEGFDCSGFVLQWLRSFTRFAIGDMTAQGIHNFLTEDNPSFVRELDLRGEDKICFGDILFYGESLQKINHVSIGISENLVIEAGGGGSTVKTKKTATAYNAMVRIRPDGHRMDMIAAIRHKYYVWDKVF